MDALPGRSLPASVVSLAAIHGGTTTLIDSVRCREGNSVADAIARRDAGWQGACHTDYALPPHGRGHVPPAICSTQLGEAHRATAIPTVKIFTTDITPSRRGRMVGFGDIWELLQVIAANGGLAVIHAEDNDIVMHMYEKLIREDGSASSTWPRCTTRCRRIFPSTASSASPRTCQGAALYMMHTSPATGVAAIREARARGLPIYGETLHQYLLYNARDYKRPTGRSITPILR